MAEDYKYDEKTGEYVPVDDYKKDSINENDRIIAIIGWALQFLNATFWPLVAIIIGYVYYKDKSVFLSETFKEILNFQISVIIYTIIFIILSVILIGIPGLIIVGIYYFIIPIFGILEAYNNKVFRVPLVIKFIN